MFSYVNKRSVGVFPFVFIQMYTCNVSYVGREETWDQDNVVWKEGGNPSRKDHLGNPCSTESLKNTRCGLERVVDLGWT